MNEKTQNFAERFFKKFPDRKLDFSNSVYVDLKTNMVVKCYETDENGIEHGEYEVNPDSLLNGYCVCPKCRAERKRLKFEENFKRKMAEKYKDKNFDTSKVYYVDQKTPVCIICHKLDEDGNEHGEFWMTPSALLLGHYCLKCRGLSKYDYDSWTAKANKVHNGKYIYPPFEYKNKNQKVGIMCPEHGLFYQTANYHIRGGGCPKCAIENNRQRIRNDRNDTISKIQARCEELGYSFVYEDDNPYLYANDVKMICPKHGEFTMNISNFLYNKYGCYKCGIERSSSKLRLSKETIVDKSNAVHNNKYDYRLFLDDSFNYTNVENKIPIICHEKDEDGDEHGVFWMTVHAHQQGNGCPICSYINRVKNNSKRWDKDALFEHLDEIHEKKYTYNKDFEYKNIYQIIDICCPKHGWFKQRIINHLSGNGCPICRESRLEKQVRRVLNELGIKYTSQYRNKELLGGQSFDFYLDEMNIAIECQGIQHFKNDKQYQEIEVIQERDDRKNKICKDNGIKIIYYFSDVFNELYRYNDLFFNNTDDLKKYLTECNNKSDH